MDNQNSLLGTVIEGSTLNDEQSIADAFKLALNAMRFDRFIFKNLTNQWTAKLVLFSGSYEGTWGLPAGYVANTGLTVGGTNVTPMSDQTTVLQPSIKCQATHVKCSGQFRHSSGEERPYNFDDRYAEPGNYFEWVTFGIAPSKNATEDKLEVFLELTDNKGDKFFYTK